MKSIKNSVKIGFGPSSSHAMGPARAAVIFKKRMISPDSTVQVELFGSLSLTGRGHLTDVALITAFGDVKVDVVFNNTVKELKHPNTMIFREMNDSKILQEWEVYSIGGGELSDNLEIKKNSSDQPDIYPFNDFNGLKKYCIANDMKICDVVNAFEEEGFWSHLEDVWTTMKQSIVRGLHSDKDYLPGEIQLKRKANDMFEYANRAVGIQRDLSLIHSYALAVAEENADGKVIVAAPTCGSSGVLPSILYYFHQNLRYNDARILRALAVAAMVGTIIETNASISGAKVGCQGEIGSACAMAAAAAVRLQDGTITQIEYAAEMGLEHFLGLTCDPILGLVQVPCIERNALASMRAMECANYVLSSQFPNLISFDEIVSVMYKTGLDMQNSYKETSLGGLAELYTNRILRIKGMGLFV